MPAGELYIIKREGIEPVSGALDRINCGGATNVAAVDMYKQYGISFTESSLSALMTPAANKSYVENTSRLQHGKRLITDKQYVKKESREVSIEMWITSKTKEEFWQRYERFCSEVLDYGTMILYSTHTSHVFKLVYNSCSQFSEFIESIAKFTLRCTEPNPTDRSLVDDEFYASTEG